MNSILPKAEIAIALGKLLSKKRRNADFGGVLGLGLGADLAFKDYLLRDSGCSLSIHKVES